MGRIQAHKGQALVEFALILPLLLFLLVAIIGSAYVGQRTIIFQNSVVALADLIAEDPTEGWRGKVQAEDRRSDCHAEPLQPRVEYPDGNDEPGSRVLVTWYCHLRTNWVFDGYPLTVQAIAVIKSHTLPKESPVPSPS